MTSLQLAAKLNRRHDSIKRTIKRRGFKYTVSSYTAKNNQQYPMLVISKKDANSLLGIVKKTYSVKYVERFIPRKKIVKTCEYYSRKPKVIFNSIGVM